MIKFSVNALVWDLAFIAFVIWCAFGQPSCARALADAQRDTLARALVAESGHYQRDWAPILYVLQRRAKRMHVDIATAARRYCNAWISRGARPRRMRQLGPSDARFVAARRFVRRWERGEVRDPCPRAMHWGAPSLRPRGRMRRVSCGPTRNHFYAVK